MSELLGKGGDRKEVLKELIRKLHAGADPAEIKAKFKEVLRGVGPTEIAIDLRAVIGATSNREVHPESWTLAKASLA